jgi:hypothetical protein
MEKAMMRNDRYLSDAAESRRQTSGPSSSRSPGRNLVIDHLDEFTSALACACSTVADYVILTTDYPAGMADS